jgi:hypothetical protein
MLDYDEATITERRFLRIRYHNGVDASEPELNIFLKTSK